MKLFEILSEAIASPRKDVLQKLEQNKAKLQRFNSNEQLRDHLQKMFPNTTFHAGLGGSTRAGMDPESGHIHVHSKAEIHGEFDDDAFDDPNYEDGDEFTISLSVVNARDHWSEFTDYVSDQLTHEMLHREQYKRRDSNKVNKNYKRPDQDWASYLAHPDEIATHAEELAAFLLRKYKTAESAQKALQSNPADAARHNPDGEFHDEEADMNHGNVITDYKEIGNQKAYQRLLKSTMHYLHEH